MRTANTKRQSGIALVAVLIFLLVIAAAAALQSGEEVSELTLAANDAELRQVEYVAQAGMERAVWLAERGACTGNLTVPVTPLDSHSYSATVDSAVATTAFTLYVDRDTWIREAAANDNFGNASELSVKNKPGDSFRALYHFDLSSIPAGSRVQSATAWFYVTVQDDQGAIEIHPVTATWTENGSTWNNISTSFSPSALSNIPPQPDKDAWVPISMNALVQQWVNEPSANHGIMLIATSNDLESRYSSREYGASLQPYLEVTVAPVAPSPVQITATGTLANGVTRTLSRNDVPAYQTSLNAVMRPDPAESEDAEIWAQAPNDNYGNAAETWVSSATNDTTRSLLRFNLGAIPVGARIVEATLSLTRQSGSGANQPVSAHRITNPWSEASVTWNKRETATNWDTAGGDFDAVAVATTLVGPTNQRYDWDITPLVQGWVDGSFPSYGVALVAAIAGMPGERFYTSDQANLGRRPSVSVTYACECGSVCLVPQGAGNVLMVIGTSPFALGDGDEALRDMVESWGYTVNFVQDDDSAGNFDAQTALNDAVLVSGTADPQNIASKLTSSTAGVVNTQATLNAALGIATNYESAATSTVTLVDASHYITQIFPPGTLTYKSQASALTSLSGTVAPGAQVLAQSGAKDAVVAAESGAAMTGGGIASGRRAYLPIGNPDYPPLLANTAQLFLQRALTWAMGADTSGGDVNLLMVVIDPSFLTEQETNKKALIESWGYTVNLIDVDDSAADFNTAAADNTVAFITEDINSVALGTKLVNAAIGVVTEEDNLSDEFGFSDGIAWGSDDQLDVDQNSHYITSPFSLGTMLVFERSHSLARLTGSLAPDLIQLASNSSDPMLVALDAGASAINGRTAAGRRVQLPWGGDNFRVADLNDNGLALFKRALDWAADNVPASLTTTPLAHWKLDETGGSNAEDMVGGHDGTLYNGPVWSAGQLDGGLEFDGSNDYIGVPHDDNLSLTEAMSFTAWINTDSVSSSYKTVISKDTGGSSSNYWFGIWEDEIAFGFVSGGTFREEFSNGLNLPTGEWHHIAATFDNATDQVLLYYDGAEVHSGSIPQSPTANSATPAIGRSPIGEYWNGSLDDVRIYDSVLSTDEIASLAAESGGGGTGGGSCNATFRDEFNTLSYGGNDGTDNWSSDWLEINENDGPTSGDERIVSIDSNYHVLVRDSDGGGEGLLREANLSAGAFATFSFRYRRWGFDNDADFVTIDVSGDGGNSWFTLESIGGSGTDSSYIDRNYDISSYIANDTQIRFLTSAQLGPTDSFYVDDVQIEVTDCATDGL